ncbi:hypothetical protein E2562_022430 [Oryza meyeriana var. granulata]|uniref:Uncharacterized protein n=1 Tax=Oryza meyeriana var. granulata TaxID=110450 RepID=A0A6G1BMG6_9ORYZ|nr:hypothetical protein E2562_022430 [Oryza meyeriana var. granulata]
MAAQESKPLLALLLCLMIAKGNCLCTGCMNDHIVVSQLMDDHSKVGGVHTLFKVTVTNRCCCEVRNVVVAAPGFQSAIPVDPKLFRRNPGGGENYLIGDGEAIPAKGSVTFFYAWRTMFSINVVGMTVSNCF